MFHHRDVNNFGTVDVIDSVLLVVVLTCLDDLLNGPCLDDGINVLRETEMVLLDSETEPIVNAAWIADNNK